MNFSKLNKSIAWNFEEIYCFVFQKGVLMIALLVAEIVVGIFAVLLQEKVRF